MVSPSWLCGVGDRERLRRTGEQVGVLLFELLAVLEERETSRVENINQTVLLTLKRSETLNECIHVNNTGRAAGQKFILHHKA